MASRLVQESGQRFADPARIGFEIGVELVRQRQARIQFDRTDECFLGTVFAAGRRVDVFPDDAVATTEMRPGWREGRVELDALLIERPSPGHALVSASEL